MSGHSKWATIKRQKAANDNARGKVFSKLSRAITIAVKTGGGPNPDSNYKLRIAIDAAKAENMPKDTIDRAINKAISSSEQMTEVVYEGFGPGGVNIIVEATTDNRNRTAQEMKSLFDRSGGSMGGPGAVAFNFDPKGFLLVAKSDKADEEMLTIIDLGVEEVEEGQEGIEVYTKPHELSEIRSKIENAGFKVMNAELIQKPKTLIDLSESEANRLLHILEALENHEDVDKVFDNAHLSDD